MAVRMCAITTKDNPFDPFDDFVNWFLFDEEKGYHSCSYLARIARCSEEFTDEENERIQEEAIALSNHKYLVGADQSCRYEYLDCNVQPRDITQSGFITFTSDADPTVDILVNVIRLELAGNGE